MKIAIIGHALDKFTHSTELKAKQIIEEILDTFKPGDILVSGRSPLGGIDVWAEEAAIRRGIQTDIKAPKQNKWNAEYGFKQRNLDIARESKKINSILVKEYPPDYKGMKFDTCYHCDTSDHVKSGACWTTKKALEFGNEVKKIII